MVSVLPYDEEKCLKSKQILGTNFIYQKKFAPSNKIGNCTTLFRKLEPIDKFDFYKKYFEYASTHINLPISERGLTYEEMVDSAKRYKQEYENSKYFKEENEWELYYYNLILHVISETYDGKINEMSFKKYLEGNGCQCDWFSSMLDTSYGSDIRVEYNGMIFAVQVKPYSFFLSKRKDVIEDRIALCLKYEKLLKEYSMKTYYAVYSKNGNIVKWASKPNGKKLFKISDFVTYDVNNIKKTMVDKYPSLLFV